VGGCACVERPVVGQLLSVRGRAETESNHPQQEPSSNTNWQAEDKTSKNSHPYRFASCRGSVGEESAEANQGQQQQAPDRGAGF
jgi:hypothetical protein